MFSLVSSEIQSSLLKGGQFKGARQFKEKFQVTDSRGGVETAKSVKVIPKTLLVHDTWESLDYRVSKFQRILLLSIT